MASTPQPASIEWVIRLLVYVVGVATTIVGSWVSSKIHAYHDSRKAHLEDIKSSVLVPIRKELERFEPFLFQRTPLFSVERGTTKISRQGTGHGILGRRGRFLERRLSYWLALPRN